MSPWPVAHALTFAAGAFCGAVATSCEAQGTSILQVGSGLAKGHVRAQDEFCRLRRAAEQNALRKIGERSLFLHTKIRDFETVPLSMMAPDNWFAGLSLAPYYPCLWTLEKTTSVAQMWDGGKWTCGLKELGEQTASPCVAYSLGSQFDTKFEQAVSEQTGGRCEIHIYDPTMGKNRARLDEWLKKLPSNMHFHEVGIKGEQATADFPAITLGEAFRQNGHDGRRGVDILKFDIEGYEYELLESADWAASRFGLVLFELHTNLINHRLGGSYNETKLDQQLRRMEDAGYRIYSAEPVCNGCVGQVELAFIHRDWDPTCGWACGCA